MPEASPRSHGMQRLVTAGLLPERAGQPVAHISLADMLMLEGSSALLEEWTEQLRARWAGHPAGASAGGSIGGAWLDGDAAQAVAVTRRWPRTSPATSTRMARGPGPGCACSWTGSAATPAPARTTPAPTKTAAFGRTAPTPATPASASSARARPARTPPRRGKPSRLSLISSGVCQALDHAAGVRSAAPAPGFSSNDGALMPLGRPRCSIVVVAAAGRTAVPGCGAGAWGSRGMRESRGGGRPGAAVGRGRRHGLGEARTGLEPVVRQPPSSARSTAKPATYCRARAGWRRSCGVGSSVSGCAIRHPDPDEEPPRRVVLVTDRRL